MILSIRIIREPVFRLENCAKRTLTGVSNDEMIKSLLVPKISFHIAYLKELSESVCLKDSG